MIAGDWSQVWLGAGASVAAGLATGVGALPILAVRRISPRLNDILLSAAGGVMLAATVFSLILPGLAVAGQSTGSPASATLLIAAGMMLGAITLWAIHRYLPHEHFIKGREGVNSANLRRIWLFVFAIGLHNLPEGLAVGVGVGGDRSADGAAGLAITLGIALQNMPEGLIIAVALAGEGYRRGFAFTIAVLSGLVEPVAGLFGAIAVNIAATMLPWGLAFAAGAMLFVISDEIVPETHRRGHATEATFGLMTGFVAMMMLSALVV